MELRRNSEEKNDVKFIFKLQPQPYMKQVGEVGEGVQRGSQATED